MKQLSSAAPRALLHTRQVQCTGWEREDGLFDIEGCLSDVRTHDQDGARGNVPRRAGDPVHLMSLRITLDERFIIVAAEACSHQAPFADCSGINAAYAQLVGLQIKGGFVKAVKALFAGQQGCTHLTELLGPMATTAFQAINPAMELRRAQRGEPMDDPKSADRLLDSCHGLRRGGHAAIVRWGPRGA
ncbi:DUF2889 domain-containing protein [Variovorax sp. JS1663]|uniref:DUF2889 domain-containing protein n=1 Tax=Variovorax sp. JS1663 TaxID=1851577 RepID=UPI000B343CC8|nr:DUF2889 domain-containing protein [Variovorax sp. JS1663]OUL99627.1 hypothetical protein A8M77_25715 [Variovorax sp. JS1663]